MEIFVSAEYHLFYRHQHDLLPTHPIILRTIDTISVKELLIRKENSHSVFFSKSCLKPNLQFFSVRSSDHRKVMIRLPLYSDIALHCFSLFTEHFCGKAQVPSIVL